MISNECIINIYYSPELDYFFENDQFFQTYEGDQYSVWGPNGLTKVYYIGDL